MLPILHQSIWRDEAFSLLLSEKSPLEIIKLTANDMTPPLGYIILHYWMILFGNNEVVARSLSFIFHLLTVFFVFLIIRKLIRSIPAQMLITFSILLNPFLLQYAFEIRPYSLFAFLTVLTVCLILINKKILAGFALALSIFTHNFAVFNFGAIILWWVYTNRNNLKITEGTKLIFFPVLALLFWGGILWGQWTKIEQGFWIEPVTFSIFLQSFEIFTTGSLFYPLQKSFFMVSLIISFLSFSFWVWSSHNSVEDKEKIPTLLFFLIFIPSITAYFISALFVPIYLERYLITSIPFLLILAGYSLYKLYSENRVKNIIVAFVAIYTVFLIQSSEQVVKKTTKPAINWGVNQILTKATTGDVIIPKDHINFLEVKYYVQKSGSKVPVQVLEPSGKVPFYIGAILFEEKEIITSLPKRKRVWQINSDGGYELLKY